MASQDECVAQFPRQQCCVDRTYARLLSWAGYITAQPLPPTDTAPPIDATRQRILAERIPSQAMGYTMQINPYLLEQPNVKDKIRVHLNAWNDDATNGELAAYIDSCLAVIMPVFADATINDGDVASWCQRNGYPVPPEIAGGVTP